MNVHLQNLTIPELSEKIRPVLPDLIQNVDYIPTQLLRAVFELVSSLAAEVSDDGFQDLLSLQFEEVRIIMR